MTREEAIKFAKHAVNMTDIPEVKEFYRLCASALRPVSRELVEKVWRGEWLHDPETGYEHCDKCSHTISLDDYLNRKPPLFCEMCGAPMTDEAMEMVMERLEAVKDAGD